MNVLVPTRTLIRRDGAWSVLPTINETMIISKADLLSADPVTADEIPTAMEGRAILRAGRQHGITPAVEEAAKVAIAHNAGRIVAVPDPPPVKVNTSPTVPSVGTAHRQIDELRAEVAVLRAELAEQALLIAALTPKKRGRPTVADVG